MYFLKRFSITIRLQKDGTWIKHGSFIVPHNLVMCLICGVYIGLAWMHQTRNSFLPSGKRLYTASERRFNSIEHENNHCHFISFWYWPIHRTHLEVCALPLCFQSQFYWQALMKRDVFALILQGCVRHWHCAKCVISTVVISAVVISAVPVKCSWMIWVKSTSATPHKNNKTSTTCTILMRSAYWLLHHWKWGNHNTNFVVNDGLGGCQKENNCETQTCYKKSIFCD